MSFLFIYKEKSGASKFKSSPENVTRVIYKIFILELYLPTFHFGINVAFYYGDKK